MSLGVNGTATIGRETQLALVDETLSSIENRMGMSVLFSGEPGIGKSHLLREIVLRAKAKSVRVVALRCIQSDNAEPFSFFLRLGTILDVAPPEHLDTDAERFRYGRSVLDAAAHVPTVVAIDDLQWCDYLSSVTLVHLFDYGVTLGIGLIGTTRPIEETEDAGVIVNLRTLARLMTHVPLPGLSRAEVSLMVVNETKKELQPSIEDSLLRLTNGNPFFVLEILRGNNTNTSLLNVSVPREVEAILDQRINLLNEHEEIVAFAAMLGVQGDRRILSNALLELGFNDAMVTSVLQQAEQLELLALKLDIYEFRHALYTQRLIERLSFLRRCAFHAVAATTLTKEARYLSALTHLINAGTSIDPHIGQPIAKMAFELSESKGDHTGVADAGTWLLEFGPRENAARIQILIPLAKAQVAIGRRALSRRNAQLAYELAKIEGDLESQAAAIMQWAARSDFTPDRGPIIKAFENLDIGSLTPETRINVLSTYAHAVTMVPTEEYVSISTGSRLISAFGKTSEDSLHEDSSTTAAWNWLVQAELARRLSTQALTEAQDPSNSDVSDAAQVQALLAWRESHRSPEFLEERLSLTARALSLVNDSSPQVESVRFCHILDLLESGEYAQADLEIAQFLQSSYAGGTFIAQWWSEFLHAGRLISKGKLAEAREGAMRAYERGENADEPGRLIVMLEQHTVILVESIIPPELSKVFIGETAVLANHYARVTAGLANASLGNTEVAERYIKESLDVLHDTDREAAWLPTVTMIIEASHLLGLFDIAAQGVALLEPYVRHQVTFIGNTARGPVRRYLGLAKHAAGNTLGAVDDLLMARNETRRTGEHLWNLACSVDLLEILATEDPDRAMQLVPEEIIVEAESSEMKWRALRGRVALGRTQREMAARLGFTERQILVLHGLTQEATIKEIADSLGFSHSTVRQESIVIYRLLGIAGRANIAERARELFLA